VKRAICFGGLLLGLAAVVGCSRSSDDLMRQQIKEINKLADAFESDASEAELESLQASMKKTVEAMEALNLSADEKAALKEKYKEELGEAGKRLAKAMATKMQGAMQDLMKGMMKGMKGEMPSPPPLP